MKPAEARDSRGGLGMAGIVLLCALAFWPMFGNGFVWDDLVFIRDNGAIRGLWPPARFFDAPAGLAQRPLLLVSYALDFRLNGLNPFGYHLTNLLLHVLCVLGVTLLGRKLFGNARLGLLAGALFAVHPGHAEAVISFLGRSDLLATAFVLWSFLAYMGSRSSSAWSDRVLYGSSLMAFALACLSKDTAAIFPVLLILGDWTQGHWSQMGRIPTLIRWSPFLVVLVLYGIFRTSIAGGLESPVWWWGGSPWRTASLVCAAYAEYLRLSIAPLMLCPWYELEQLGGMGWRAVLGLIAVGLSLTGLVLLPRRSARQAFLLGWFLFCLSPVLLPWLLIGLGSRLWGVLPGTMMAERWLYLPSVALCLAGARGWMWGRDKLSPPPRWAWVGLMAGVLLLFGARTLAWNSVWKNQRILGQTVLSRFPKSYLGHLVLGAGLIEEGRFEDGVKHYQEAVALRPDLAWIRYNFAGALSDIGRVREAIEQYRMVLEIQPQNASAYNNLGSLLYQQGSYVQAESAFREAVRLAPDLVNARVNLGNVLDDLGRPVEAEAEYREAVRLAPDFAGAYYNLAVALIRQGRKAEGIEALEAFLAHGGQPRSEVEPLIRKLRGP